MPDETTEQQTERHQQVQQMMFHNYGTLESTAYDEYPALSVWDCEGVLETLASELSAYEGPLAEAALIAWATEIVAKEAARYRIATDIITEYGFYIRTAIRRAVAPSEHNRAEDWAIQEDDLFWEVASIIFQNAHSLHTPGKAKLTTRLWALVDTHVRLYHNSKINRRHKLNRIRLEQGLCYGLPEREVVPEAERAALAKNGTPVSASHSL